MESASHHSGLLSQSLFHVVPKAVDDLDRTAYHRNNAEQLHGGERKQIEKTVMSEINYKATLSGERGRSGLCMIFRHPVRKNPDGSPKRVRRGLGTRIEADAQRLVDQMNVILGDVTFWTPQARAKAESLFDARIVDAFYHDLLPGTTDAWMLRNEIIPIPTTEEGYARARFLGTTGAGKTTLVRQIIGTNPATERFPSTSTAKTTVCDIEIVLAPGPFKAVVTFFPREQVRMLIEECALAAATTSVFEADKLAGSASRLLEHSEQRFRLSYILGGVKETAEELSDEEDASSTPVADELPEVTEAERQAMSDQIIDYVSRIEAIAHETELHTEKELEVNLKEMEKKELDAFQELFEHELRQREGFHSLVDEILDRVEERFAALAPNGFRRDRSDWPLLWEFETGDRTEFIRTVNRFSSNYAPNFGKLLTPLVQGIRVRGPFQPDWYRDGECKLVLMDGEGLGHTPDSSASISTNITQRLNDVDAVVLVDSAEQPMQAGPQALLRTLAASGHENKLIVCFTHFDGVKGDNLQNVSAKKQHVYKSLQNAIGSVREVLGRSAENALSRTVADRVFFVSNIQEPIKATAQMTLDELRRIIKAIQATIIPPPPAKVRPIYDVANLILCIPQAMAAFRDPWRGKLRLPSRSNVSPEHWTRIKALSRRFAEQGTYEYDTLRPVADFILRLSEHIIVFLASPLRWQPGDATEEMKRQVVDAMARRVFSDLHELGARRLFHERVKEWAAAYAHRGTGSTYERAQDIDGIYDVAAPIPGKAASENASKLVTAIMTTVKDSVGKSGGEFQ